MPIRIGKSQTAVEAPELVSPDGTQRRKVGIDNEGSPPMQDSGTPKETVYVQRSSASNATRTDRAAGTAYQISTTRPSSVTVNFTISVTSGQTASVALYVGPTEAELVEQARRELGLLSTGTVAVVGTLLSLVITTNEKGAIKADVPPGQYYKIVVKTEGATLGGNAVAATINYVKERVF
jgi:hypothetical protein